MTIELPSKDVIKEAMLKASCTAIKEKTGIYPNKEEIDRMRTFYADAGDVFIDVNLDNLKSKCEQVEQEVIGIPADITSIPIELALPNDLVIGAGATAPNPLAVAEKFIQKINGVKSRILAVFIVLEEIHHICKILKIAVPTPIESAKDIMNKAKSTIDNMKVPIVG